MKETKNLADTVLNMADLIEVKGMKAQGNQITKLKVKEIVLTHPIDESPEAWPIEEEVLVLNEDAEDIDDAAEMPTMEWDLTKEEEEDDQMKLFDEE